MSAEYLNAQFDGNGDADVLSHEYTSRLTDMNRSAEHEYWSNSVVLTYLEQKKRKSTVRRAAE